MADVLIIGGGVAGIEAALKTADNGIQVHLVEREPSIGGRMSQLDKTFPTNDCSMCILSPKMVDVVRHPLITVYTCSEVTGVCGERGDFEITIQKNPRYINESACNGCGDCIDICPVEIYNRFDAGMGIRKAIYKPHPQAVPDIVVKDEEHCIECGLCYDVCGLNAIKKEDVPELIKVNVSSIILATGYQIFNPEARPALNYKNHPDVITGLELERLINASGPTGGVIKCPSNGKEPDSIAFIQCVGSRDMAIGRPYCSCVCCMAAIKNSILIREKHPETIVTIFYIDIRTYGKGYEEYYNRAVSLGVRFVRGLPSEVTIGRDGLTLVAENTENCEILTIHPSLVILSAGMEPSDTTSKMAGILGIDTDSNGFIAVKNEALDPVATTIPGIYVAGTATAPKDIPDTVAFAGAAALRAVNDARRVN